MSETELKSTETSLGKLIDWTKLGGEGVTVATFSGFNESDQFLVALTDELEPIAALSTLRLTESEIGNQVVVAFERNKVRSPVIIGLLQDRKQSVKPSIFKLDGERLVLKAEREIEFRCGDASIVLTKAGKVLIKGNYVLTRSRGANKIKGAYVDIN